MPKKNPMRVACPECQSLDVRTSAHRHFGEKLLELLGYTPMRCQQCHCRWRESVWKFTEMLYARCPRCYRLDLTTWEETYYHVGFWAKLKVSCGGKKVRCKVCRHNFVSFGRVKGRRKWTNVDPGETPVVETTISLNEISKSNLRGD
jgi:hypothetical protein